MDPCLLCSWLLEATCIIHGGEATIRVQDAQERYQDAAARTRGRIETQTLTEKEDMVQKANSAEEKLEVHNVLPILFLGKDPVITECLQS